MDVEEWPFRRSQILIVIGDGPFLVSAPGSNLASGEAQIWRFAPHVSRHVVNFVLRCWKHLALATAGPALTVVRAQSVRKLTLKISWFRWMVLQDTS